MLSDWVAFVFPPRTSRTLSIALTNGHDKPVPEASSDRHSVAVALSSSL